MTLIDGVASLLTYGDQNDINKFMFFSVPEGLHTININVKAVTKGFHPHLYVNYIENVKSLNSSYFPPTGDEGSVYVRNKWDREL
jgi:hypothetical protein